MGKLSVPRVNAATTDSVEKTLLLACSPLYSRAGIFKNSMRARHRVGIGLSYRPARLHRLHCEKSLFVSASRQKIPVLRTENPPVDTRTICLLPIEFFKLPMAEKFPARNNRYGRKIMAFWCQKR
jgi:hypothetical protein